MLKSINVRVPMYLAHDMSERGHLNPQYITDFIYEYLPLARELDDPILGDCFNYSLKVPEHYHRNIKIMSANEGIAMNELLGRLLVKYYS